MRQLVLCFCFLSACGDDSVGGSGGTGGPGGAGGAGGADARMSDAGQSDAFIRGDGGFPMNIGAPCDPNNPAATQQNPAPDCGTGTDWRCEAPDFFGCTPGFCARICSATNACPQATTCAHLPL